MPVPPEPYAYDIIGLTQEEYRILIQCVGSPYYSNDMWAKLRKATA